MYLPPLFAERDPERLRDFLETYPFGALVAPGDPPEITHVPFVLIRERDALWGHVARANPIWRSFDGSQLTAIFQGPHGYISPRFYASAQQVPTWNYVAVHVRGAPRQLDRDEEVVALLRRLSSHNEASVGAQVGAAGTRPAGAWTPDELEPDFFADLRRAIVAFELPLSDVVGKFKLSQNRDPADRESVRQALEARGTPDDLAMLRLMQVRGSR